MADSVSHFVRNDSVMGSLGEEAAAAATLVLFE
jgi:hypothetical protein